MAWIEPVYPVLEGESVEVCFELRVILGGEIVLLPIVRTFTSRNTALGINFLVTCFYVISLLLYSQC